MNCRNRGLFVIQIKITAMFILYYTFYIFNHFDIKNFKRMIAHLLLLATGNGQRRPKRAEVLPQFLYPYI
jgi:hypothetical protein